jgi:glyoxalase/bleomycin resistance protein/dioxygenase superfamily protein
MLERVDRMQLVVRDRVAAARSFNAVLGAEPVREAESPHLGARRTVLALGESEIELCEPAAPGPAADHLALRGEGLMTAGLSVRDVSAFHARLAGLGVSFTVDGEQTYLPATECLGLPVVLTPVRPRPRVGLVRHLYEVTHTLVSDWRLAAARFTALFGLDPARFSPLESHRFGYVGTLTLLDPPGRLDRIELSQVVSQGSAMGRWVAKHGDSLYMCYAEVDEVRPVIERLERRGGRWTPRGADPAKAQDGLWVHPSVLHGMLLGISRTTLAWGWSGHPELVAPRRP